MICVKVFACQECLPQYCDRQVCMDLSFGDALNPSVNKRGFGRFAESHPVAAFLHLQHLTTQEATTGFCCKSEPRQILLKVELWLTQVSQRWDWPCRIYETIIRRHWKSWTHSCFVFFCYDLQQLFKLKSSKDTFLCLFLLNLITVVSQPPCSSLICPTIMNGS